MMVRPPRALQWLHRNPPVRSLDPRDRRGRLVVQAILVLGVQWDPLVLTARTGATVGSDQSGLRGRLDPEVLKALEELKEKLARQESKEPKESKDPEEPQEPQAPPVPRDPRVR